MTEGNEHAQQTWRYISTGVEDEDIDIVALLVYKDEDKQCKDNLRHHIDYGKITHLLHSLKQPHRDKDIAEDYSERKKIHEHIIGIHKHEYSYACYYRCHRREQKTRCDRCIEDAVDLCPIVAVDGDLPCYRKAETVCPEKYKIEGNIIYKDIGSVCLEAKDSNQIRHQEETDYLADGIQQRYREEILDYLVVLFYV